MELRCYSRKMIKKKPFVKYDPEENKKNILSIKLNEKDEEMLDIGCYMFNQHSKSGVLKDLAHIGLKVVQRDLGVDKMHKLTSGDRVRLIRKKPECLER